MKTIRKLSLCDVRNAPKEKRVELGTLNVNGSDQPILQRSITLAMSRDPRRNTQMSAALAMQIAKDNPAMSVVYVNTYAGVELMRKSFSLEDTTAQPPALSEERANSSKECVELENLHILNIPFAEWDLATIVRTLRPNSAEPSPLDKPIVLIVNDFELSGFTAWQRRCVARDLIQLNEQIGMTVIVFSHEMREELKAGMPGRGALGLLAIKAESVHRILGEFDQTIKTRKQAETATVHEAQTKEEEYKLTRNSLEGGQDLFEIPIISSHFEKPPQRETAEVRSTPILSF
jgi:hypothetical protein